MLNVAELWYKLHPARIPHQVSYPPPPPPGHLRPFLLVRTRPSPHPAQRGQRHWLLDRRPRPPPSPRWESRLSQPPWPPLTPTGASRLLSVPRSQIVRLSDPQTPGAMQHGPPCLAVLPVLASPLRPDVLSGQQESPWPVDCRVAVGTEGDHTGSQPQPRQTRLLARCRV